MTVFSQAYCDESGGFDTGHFVLGGYVGETDMWKSFAADWQEVLDKSPALPPFHAVHFESGKNGFEVLDERMKAERLRDLVRVVQRYRPQGVLIIVGMDDFRRRVPPRSAGKLKKKEGWKYPYQYAAAYMVGALCDLHEEIGKDLGTVEVLFDYMEQLYGSTSRLVEESVRSAIADESPRHAARLGEVRWPKPKDRANYVPTQAADLLVWHQRRARDEPDGRTRRAWRELNKAPVKYITERKGFDSLGDWIYGHSGGAIDRRRV